MAAPRLDIDREQVKLLCLSLGVREAARQMGLKEDTVKKWAQRGRWLANCRPTPAAQPLPPSCRPTIVPNVPHPADALIKSLTEHGDRTKIALARAATRGAETVADMLDPVEALEHTQDLVGLAKVAASVHGWGSAQQSAGLNIVSQINIELGAGRETTVIDC